MSAIVLGLVYRTKFGSLAAKAIAAKLADNSNDDGENIFPSKRTVADAVECAKRTVDKYMDLWLVIDLLRIETKGGGRHRNAVRNGRVIRCGRASLYAWNMPLLEQLAAGTVTIAELIAAAQAKGLVGPDGWADPEKVQQIKDAAGAPFSRAADEKETVQPVHPLQPAKGCTPCTQRVHPVHPEGAPGAPEPSMNHHLTSPPTPSGEEGGRFAGDPRETPEPEGGAEPGFARGWTEAAQREIADLRANPIAGHVAVSFLDLVAGTLNPPHQADPVAYVRQLRNRLQPFSAEILRQLADKLIATRGRDLPATAQLVASATVLKRAAAAAAERQRISGTPPGGAPVVIRPDQIQWQSWIAHLEKSGAAEVARAAVAAGAITVTHKLPLAAGAKLLAVGEPKP